MGISIAPTILIAACWLSGAAVALSADPPSVSDIVRTMRLHEDPANDVYAMELAEGLAEQYQRLWSDADDTRRAELRQDPNTGIALQAAWQEVRRTAPSKLPPEPVKIDTQAVQKFIRFVEGRLPVKLPEMWVHQLSESSYGAGSHRLFIDNPHLIAKQNTSRNYRVPGRRDLPIQGFWIASSHARGLEDRQGALFIDTGDVACTVPREIIAQLVEIDALVADPMVEAVAAPSNRVLVAFRESTGSPFPLYCLDRTSSKTLWRTRSWGEGPAFLGGRTGMWRHDLNLIVEDKTVYLFGITVLAVYIEAFSIETGEAEFRFSTSY